MKKRFNIAVSKVCGLSHLKNYKIFQQKQNYPLRDEFAVPSKFYPRLTCTWSADCVCDFATNTFDCK